MKYKKYKKFILLIAILFISIGFAVLTTNLSTIASLSFYESSFELYFYDIKTLNTSTVSNPNASITNDTNISYSGTFNKPGDFIEFSFYIVNNGTIDGQINQINTGLTIEQSAYISYDFKYDIDNSNVNINDIIYAGQARKVIAHFEYKEDIADFINISSLNVNLTMKFIQPQIVTTTVWNYEYLGDEQYFIVPKDGKYKIELWGAQGGDATPFLGGYGAYAKGEMNLSKNNIYYINIGGQPLIPASNTAISGGYNGGGGARTKSVNDKAGGGGGATSIALSSGTISMLNINNKKSDIIMIASGGGGAYRYINDLYASSGGSGGGITGSLSPWDGDCYNRLSVDGNKATQATSGGNSACYGSQVQNTTFGDFGLGGILTGSLGDWYSGGGAGYYGGGAGFAHGGNGGSSYIGYNSLSNAEMYCYNCDEDTNAKTKTVTTTNTNKIPNSRNAKIGNGHARITYIE